LSREPGSSRSRSSASLDGSARQDGLNEGQCNKLLDIENRASRCAQFPFVLERDLPSRFWMEGAICPSLEMTPS
jgi:hypothetical protein